MALAHVDKTTLQCIRLVAFTLTWCLSLVFSAVSWLENNEEFSLPGILVVLVLAAVTSWVIAYSASLSYHVYYTLKKR